MFLFHFKIFFFFLFLGILLLIYSFNSHYLFSLLREIRPAQFELSLSYNRKSKDFHQDLEYAEKFFEKGLKYFSTSLMENSLMNTSQIGELFLEEASWITFFEKNSISIMQETLDSIRNECLEKNQRNEELTKDLRKVLYSYIEKSLQRAPAHFSILSFYNLLTSLLCETRYTTQVWHRALNFLYDESSMKVQRLDKEEAQNEIVKLKKTKKYKYYLEQAFLQDKQYFTYSNVFLRRTLNLYLINKTTFFYTHFLLLFEEQVTYLSNKDLKYYLSYFKSDYQKDFILSDSYYNYIWALCLFYKGDYLKSQTLLNPLREANLIDKSLNRKFNKLDYFLNLYDY